MVKAFRGVGIPESHVRGALILEEAFRVHYRNCTGFGSH